MAYDPRTGFRTKLDSEAELIREEVADVVGLSPAEHLRLLAAACRSGSQLLAMKSAADRSRVLDHRDPLDPAAEAVIARLRAQFRARKAAR